MRIVRFSFPRHNEFATCLVNAEKSCWRSPKSCPGSIVPLFFVSESKERIRTRKLLFVACSLLVVGSAAMAQNKVDTKWNCPKQSAYHKFDVGDVAGHSYMIPRSPVPSVRGKADRHPSTRVSGSHDVLDDGRSREQAARFQDLLQQPSHASVTERANAEDAPVTTSSEYPLISMATPLWSPIPDTSRCLTFQRLELAVVSG